MDKNKPQRAGDLAIKILLNIPDKIPENSKDEREEGEQPSPTKRYTN
jgi:hypothetical protein